MITGDRNLQRLHCDIIAYLINSNLVACHLAFCKKTFFLRQIEFEISRVAISAQAAFFIVVAFCLLGFTHAYYVLGTREGPSLPYAAFLPTFRLGVTGDYDMHELSGVDPVLVLVERFDIEPFSDFSAK